MLLNSVSLAGLYVLLAAFSYGVASDSNGIALVWLPSSVAAAWIMSSRPSHRGFLYGAAFVASSFVAWLYGKDIICIFGCSVAKLAGIVVAVRLLSGYFGKSLTVRDLSLIHI